MGQFFHDGLIGVGDSYSRTESVLVPWAARGPLNLFVVTDAANAVYEFLYDDNNAGPRGEPPDGHHRADAEPGTDRRSNSPMWRSRPAACR